MKGQNSLTVSNSLQDSSDSYAVRYSQSVLVNPSPHHYTGPTESISFENVGGVKMLPITTPYSNMAEKEL